MALSSSARTRKHQLKKQGYTDEQIWKYLAENGFISEKDTKKESKDTHKEIVNNVNISLDKEGYKNYLKKCLEESDPTPSLLKEFREFLELEGELKQKEAIAHKPDEVRQRLGEMSFT